MKLFGLLLLAIVQLRVLNKIQFTKLYQNLILFDCLKKIFIKFYKGQFCCRKTGELERSWNHLGWSFWTISGFQKYCKSSETYLRNFLRRNLVRRKSSRNCHGINSRLDGKNERTVWLLYHFYWIFLPNFIISGQFFDIIKV